MRHLFHAALHQQVEPTPPTPRVEGASWSATIADFLDQDRPTRAPLANAGPTARAAATTIGAWLPPAPASESATTHRNMTQANFDQCLAARRLCTLGTIHSTARTCLQASIAVMIGPNPKPRHNSPLPRTILQESSDGSGLNFCWRHPRCAQIPAPVPSPPCDQVACAAPIGELPPQLHGHSCSCAGSASHCKPYQHANNYECCDEPFPHATTRRFLHHAPDFDHYFRRMLVLIFIHAVHTD